MVNEMNHTKAYLLLQERESPFLSQVNKAIEFASQILPMVTKVFQTYTLHGMTHSAHVAEYMQIKKSRRYFAGKDMFESIFGWNRSIFRFSL